MKIAFGLFALVFFTMLGTAKVQSNHGTDSDRKNDCAVMKIIRTRNESRWSFLGISNDDQKPSLIETFLGCKYYN